ncbi:MAG TPA: SH3 domain-containing protein [Allosphingosinicella sp.]
MIRLLIAAALLTVPAAANAQNRRVPPVDRCSSEPSFVRFRNQLRAAVARRDGAFLLSIAAPNIEYSFGDSPGRAGFVRAWGLTRPASSRIWHELEEVLRLGCDRAEDGEYWAPSLSLAQDEMDLGEGPETLLAVGPAAILHAAPSESSPVVARLEWDILTSRGEDDGQSQWIEVALGDGTRGFVRRSLVRSQGDYRAVFGRVGGRWRMTAFVAGD